MAKESIKARERKRAKMVAKYAAKRAALKEIVRTGEPEDVEKAVILAFNFLGISLEDSLVSFDAFSVEVIQICTAEVVVN